MKAKRAILIISVIAIAGAVIYAMLAGAAGAEGAGDHAYATVREKLEAILLNQKSIMEDLASIKEDLRIIQIRVTQNQ